MATCLVVIAADTAPANADTPYTYLDEDFASATFPPTDWTATSGTWSKSCTPAPPNGGCFAVATVTDPTPGVTSQLLFDPAVGIPANLQNPTLTFTSNFTPDAQSSFDIVSVYQPLQGDSLGDLRLLADIAGGVGPGDAHATNVTHTIPLSFTNLPLVFRWTSFGSSATSIQSTWAIANVTITGTLPDIPYVLTANPIPNTQYHPVAGTPITLTLSGSSDPVGDTLIFGITTPPALGTLGPITPTDATHATVEYTTPVLACPNPDGVPTFICVDSFQFNVSDALGNVSAPANVQLDVSPGGAGGQQVVVSAPSTSDYETLSQNGQLTQGSNLSGEVAVGPVGFPDAVELHLVAATGTIELFNAAASGVTFLNGTSGSGQQIHMKGSVAKLNTALGLFLYFPPSGTTPTTTVDLLAADLGAFGTNPFVPQAQATITINGLVNTPRPVLTMPTGPLSIGTTSDPLAFPPGAATGFTLVDDAATPTTNDTVSLNVTGGTLAIPDADTTGPSPLVNAQSFGSTLNLTGTVANLNTALGHVTFDPSGLPSSTVTLSGFAINPETTLASVIVSVPITVIQGPSVFGGTSFGTLQNVPVTLFLCARGPAGAQLSFTVTTPPAHGSLVADPSASAATSGCSINPDTLISGYTYTPSTGYVGPDGFTYTVADASTGLTSAPSTVAITVHAHTKPTAYPRSVSTRQDQPVDIVLCGTNPDPAPNLTFVITMPPGSGTLADQGTPALNPCNNGNEARTYRWTPLPGTFTVDGTDTFTYLVTNGADSDPVTATINVFTRTPQVIARQLDVDENSSLGIYLCATVPNGPLTFTTVGPSHGTLDDFSAATYSPACPDGYFGMKYVRYVPTTYYSGTDQIVYSVTDGLYSSVQATIDITVHFVDIPPTADSQTVTAIVPHAAPITLTGASVHNLPLTYRVVDPPAHGTLTGTAPNLAYTPSIASGTDTFTFVANDGTSDSAPATVTIVVVTPDVRSSVCVPTGPELSPNHYACGATLDTVSDGAGGQIALAHMSGARNAHLRLQVEIRNTTAAADTVTMTASAVASPWAVRYATDGQDLTDDLLDTGVVVTLGPAGSTTASAFIVVDLFAPRSFPSPATTTFTVSAVSGNDRTKSTSIPVLVMDGSSSPSLALAQSDGTGKVAFPNSLDVSPTLYLGGPAGGARILPDIVGTGTNTFRIRSTVQPWSTADVGVQYILGASTDVTNQVVAGTLTMQCYEGASCPPIRAVLTPGAIPGRFAVLVEQTSTIDGQSSIAVLNATVASAVGPDLYTSLPLVGLHVHEATPATQTSTIAVQTSGTASKRIVLHNEADVADTFTVAAAITTAAGDTSAITITAYDDLSGPVTGVDVTSALKAGTFKVTLGAGDNHVFIVNDAAGSTPGLAPATATLTATSKLGSKVDAYRVSFATFFYRPDAVLVGVNGQAIGERVYGGTSQTDLWNTSLTPTPITVRFEDRGSGPWTANDSVVVTAPASTSDFTLSYRLTTGGASTDVTPSITGAGLHLTLGADGSPPQTLVVSAASAITGRPGFPGYFTITVRSLSSLPAPLEDSVRIQLYNTGASQLRFAGLPQPEPPDLTQEAIDDGFGNRVPPFPSAGYAPGITYGAYPDPTGQKFAYVSAYDTIGLQVAAEKVTATRYRLQLTNPSLTSLELPAWERLLFGLPYYNAGQLQTPADPLGATTSVNPKITVGGTDVTAAVLAGTYTTPALGTRQTLDVSVSFSPPAGTSQRYRPLRFALVNADTGDVEDVMVLGLSSIIECSVAGYGQQLASIVDSTGRARKLAFRSFDRTLPAATNECMQRLSHSWVTKHPVVFGSHQAATATEIAGGDAPHGLWLLPQGGIVRIDTDTLTVTSPHAKAYVDTALTDDDGLVDPATISLYTFVGDLPNLSWRTTDSTSGLQVSANTLLPRSPFPMVAPSQAAWPNNTMGAFRYFQVQTTTGTPVMVGTMRVNEPWFKGDIDLVMPIDNTNGLVLDYKAPSNATASLPGDDSVETYGFFWRTKKDGTVVQGGCLGLPPALLSMIGINKSVCIVSATTTFLPIPNDPSQEAKIANITFQLKKVAVTVGTPEFNIKELNGHINLDPATGRVTEVVVKAIFNVGPETPCQIDKKARKAAGVPISFTQKVLDAACPSNYFTFDAEITFKEGGFTAANATSGYGIRFTGTLSFLRLVRLTSVVADIATDPFNFHFANSPIDLAISAGISASARITFDGNVGANGFDISLSGSVTVMGLEILSASGILSTKGMGVCGGFAGVSAGFGYEWGASPTFYPSGCTITPYKVNE